jgi:predicted nucleotidyltransferase
MHHIIENNKEKINEICKRHYVKNLYVFGSINENFTERSDIDFLYAIDLEKFKDWATGNYDYVENIISLEMELKKLFHRNIDLIPDLEIRNKYLKQSIEETKQLIYAA